MIEPYLNLGGRALEAIEFYKEVFGGTDLKVLKLSDMPPNPYAPVTEETRDMVAFAKMTMKGTIFNFSDMQPNPPPSGMLTLMVHFDTLDEVKAAYERLSEGGIVLMELAPQPYGELFAWVVDKFGVGWQIMKDVVY